MRCEICGQLGRHDSRCPNYVMPKSHYYCSVCGEGIYSGDEYIKNDSAEYIHWDCCHSCRDLVKWLGYEIRIMDENDD